MTNEQTGLENAVEIKGGMNGLKLILGAALIVLSHQLSMVHDLMPLYPDSGFLGSAVTYLDYGITGLTYVSQFVGDGLMGVGVVHKILKLFHLV